MAVAGQKFQAVLEGDGGNPDVVGGDGRALGAQTDQNFGIDISGLVVDRQDFDPGGIEEDGQFPAVFPFAAPGLKPRKKLTETDGADEEVVDATAAIYMPAVPAQVEGGLPGEASSA